MDLCACFLESKCPEKGNVQEFLDGLCVKREVLASIGVDIDEKDYCSTIISTLPIALANFASSQLASTRLYTPMKTIALDSLISLISEEYEQQKAQCSRRSGTRKGKDDDKDEALSVSWKAKGEKGERKQDPRKLPQRSDSKIDHFPNPCPDNFCQFLSGLDPTSGQKSNFCPDMGSNLPRPQNQSVFRIRPPRARKSRHWSIRKVLEVC